MKSFLIFLNPLMLLLFPEEFMYLKKVQQEHVFGRSLTLAHCWVSGAYVCWCLFFLKDFRCKLTSLSGGFVIRGKGFGKLGNCSPQNSAVRLRSLAELGSSPAAVLVLQESMPGAGDTPCLLLKTSQTEFLSGEKDL